MPVGAENFREGLRWCCEIYHTLAGILKEKGLSTAVGDEGGFAPNLSRDEEAIEIIISAVDKAGYDTERVKIALDAAGSEWAVPGTENGYMLPKRQRAYSSGEMIDYWCKLTRDYPIVSIEDPLSEEDWNGFTRLTDCIGKNIQIVGDDLFVTNKKKLANGIKCGAANAILIKPNQIGTLSEAVETIRTAIQAGFKIMISHRSGETEDHFIADLAVACGCGAIKTGAPARSERTAKYNRLVMIESDLGDRSEYSKWEALDIAQNNS